MHAGELGDPIDVPYFVDAPSGPLVAVETTATGIEAKGLVVLCSGAWHGGSSLKNRILVHMAHRLASAGFKVVRFDWPGCGESTGHVDRFDLSIPSVDEVRAVVDAAQGREPLPLYLVGICFGATSALPVAVDRPELRGIALVSLPIPTHLEGKAKQQAKRMGVRQVLRAVLSPTLIKGWFDSPTRTFYLKWIRLRFIRKAGKKRVRMVDALQDIQSLLDRRVPVLLLYGEQDWQGGSAEDIGAHPLSRLVGDNKQLATLEIIDGDLQGFPAIEVQQRTNDIVTGWLLDLGVDDSTGSDRRKTMERPVEAGQ